MADYPYTVEYAKSSRASCKGCKMPIDKDAIRFGIMSSHFDGRIPMWHHWPCFWRKVRFGADESDFHGLEKIRWDDQEKVREQIKNNPKGSNNDGRRSTMSSNGGSPSAAAVWAVEYSKGICKCRLCDAKISKGEMRIANKKLFYHVDCVSENKQQIGLDIDAKQLIGFDDIDLKDQRTCAEKIQAPTLKRPSEESKNNGDSSLKKQKISDVSEKEKNLLKDALRETLKFSDMSEMLVNHDQHVPVQSSIIERLADCMLFGPVKPCPECFKGQLVYSSTNNAYVCTGSISGFTKCQYETQDPERSVFNFPSEYREYGGFLAKYKFVPGRKRIFPPTSRRSTDEQNGKVTSKKKSYAIDYVSSAPSTAKFIVKDGTAVDPESNLASVAHIYQDKEENKYSVILNSVDVQGGMNSYYKLQLIEHDQKKHYYVFRAWGRIGTSIGNTKVEKFKSDLLEALKNFKFLYLEKTGNEWDNRHNFVKRFGKFMPVEIDYGPSELSESKIKPRSITKLKVPIQDFIEDIFDVNQMKETMKEFEIDLKKMPLGKLSTNQIKTAYTVLTRLQYELQNASTNDSKRRAEILDCTNQFYTLVPHDFGMASPPLINSLSLVQSKSEMLDNLLEIELAYNILKNDTVDDSVDPIDAHYKKLCADMDVVDKTTSEFQMILQYVQNTHAATHTLYKLEIDQVLIVNRRLESERYKKFASLHNRMLLWHGSRTTNYAGIVSQGLRIAPPEAPVTGYMFGKGIYFADMVSKSANYCCTTSRKNTGYLLLCEVALGDMHELTVADPHLPKNLPHGKHSVKGCGKTMPDPAEYLITPDGVVVPKGKGVESHNKNSTLLYNE
uniref:Poly [ADP-ribose] polymerase n=1 Tax=Romanomermis culicivorax TaxID=13658 RepID=A0A915HV21_ROMCU